MTDYTNKVKILHQVYKEYGEDEAFAEFIAFNDMGVPLAYLATEGLCTVNQDGARYIEDSFAILLGEMSIEDNTNYTSVEEMLTEASGL